jgi:hypothetical protein
MRHRRNGGSSGKVVIFGKRVSDVFGYELRAERINAILTS